MDSNETIRDIGFYRAVPANEGDKDVEAGIEEKAPEHGVGPDIHT